MSFPEYSVFATSTGTVNIGKLHAELVALAVPEYTHVEVENDETIFIRTNGVPSPANIQAFDNAIAAHVAPTALDRAKQAKNQRIDDRSVDLEAEGFTYSGKKLGLTGIAQSRAAALKHIVTDPSVSFPITVETADGLDSIEIANPGAFNQYYTEQALASRAIQDSGDALKNQVRAATTIEEVDAIVDDR